MVNIILTSAVVCALIVTILILPVFVSKLLPKKILYLVEKQLKDRYQKEGVILPDGWYPAHQIRNVHMQWKRLPWGTGEIIVKLRCLTAGEKPEVSVLSRISAIKDNANWESKARYLNTLEEYARKALVSPTYEEIEQEVLGCDGKAKELREKLKAMQEDVKENEKDNRERMFKEKDLHEMELMAGYCMPVNFMQAIATWAECLDITEIGKIEDKELLSSWLLAQEYHNRASDNVNGVFFSAHRIEYDVRAAEIGHRHKKEQDEKFKNNKLGKIPARR